jgi:hypothetical protein
MFEAGEVLARAWARVLTTLTRGHVDISRFYTNHYWQHPESLPLKETHL